MPRSAGTYTPPASTWSPAVNAASATFGDWNSLLTDIANALTQSMSLDGQSTPTGNLPMGGFKLTGLGAGTATGNSLRWEQLFDQGTEATLGSATTTDIGAQNTNFLQITGTTTITSFGANYKGPRFLRFAGALTLTHNASTLILPGGANITTAAGDTCIAIPLAAGWYVQNYQPAATSSALVSGTLTATTSGTAINYTGIPSWAKRVTLMFSGVSTSGTSQPIIQLGTSSGVETSGYLGAGLVLDNTPTVLNVNYTNGFGIPSGSAANVIHGSVVIEQLDAATFRWVARGNLSLSNGASTLNTSGSKTLAAALDRIRLTTAGGVDTFDAGAVNILYE